MSVHTDPKSAQSAHEVNALAYTVGHDIVFDVGRYAPSSREGQELIAHELAHVVQQGKRWPSAQPGDLFVGPADAPSEYAAQSAAKAAVQGDIRTVAPKAAFQPLKAQAPLIQRQEAGEKVPPLQLPPLVGNSVDLTVDGFGTDSAELSPKQKEQLTAFAGVILANLSQYSNSFVTVTGHTDAIGGEAVNKALGQRRADVVRDFLLGQKVPAAIVHAYSLGKSMLRVSTRSAEARNRRAEISLTLREGPGARVTLGGKRTLRFPLPPINQEGTATIKKNSEAPRRPVKQEKDEEQPPPPALGATRQEADKPHFGKQVGAGVQTNVVDPHQPFAYVQITGEYSDAFAASFEGKQLPRWLSNHVGSLKFFGEPGLTLQFHYLGDSVATFDVQFLFKLIQASVNKVGDLSLVGGASYTDIFNRPKSVRFTPLVGVEGERELGKALGGKVSIVLDMLLGAQNVDVPLPAGPPPGTDAEQTRKLNVQFSGELRLSY